MDTIKFGTDGWRAIIAKEFTTQNVNRVSQAVAKWLKGKYSQPSVTLGHDCRFAGDLFSEEAIRVFLHHGIKVYAAPGPVTTPMVSMATLQKEAQIGVVITASHNPPSYNGYKLKGSFGGPLLPHHIQEVEDAIEAHSGPIYEGALDAHESYELLDMESMYVKAVESSFDMALIRSKATHLAYDAMFGAGQFVMKRLFGADMTYLHCDTNPGFYGTAPEPILKNLKPFARLMAENADLHCGLATDGDADRIGLFNRSGHFVDSHHIILLLVHYLVKYKGYTGKVISAFSVSRKLQKLCAHYGLELHTTKIGFKHITGFFLEEDILLGGEESGGIAVKGHIPERDGIWMGLIVWEFMAKSGKTLEELIEEVYAITGPFSYNRWDLHLSESQKQGAMERCAKGLDAIGGRRVQGIETLDGYKFLLENDGWLLVRASGTEPVVRLYGEAESPEATEALLKDAQAALIPE